MPASVSFVVRSAGIGLVNLDFILCLAVLSHVTNINEQKWFISMFHLVVGLFGHSTKVIFWTTTQNILHDVLKLFSVHCNAQTKALFHGVHSG